MAVPSVFLSSVVRGYEDVRAQAADAIERVGMHAVLSEHVSADAASPRRALLNQVARCDIYLLLLGARYGEFTSGGKSPTEDEYDEAVRLNRPVIVLVQETEMEPAQQAFLDRVRGSWGDGVLYGRFNDASDVGAAVAGALARHETGILEDASSAQARAVTLAGGADSRSTLGSGVAARIAYVPLRQTVLLDAIALESTALGDSLASALRSSGLVPQRIGLRSHVSAAGVRLEGTDTDNWTRPETTVGTDGTVVIVGSVAVEGGFGFALVDPGRLEALIRRAGAFVQRAFDEIDGRGEVTRFAVTAAIPEAAHKGFGATSSNRMSISTNLPATVVAPDPAEVVPRGQLGDATVAQRLVAAIRRVFADAGAVQQ